MNIILLIFCLVPFCASQEILCDDPFVKVQQGWLHGKLQDAVTGDFQYYSFENIPYAKPPIGPLRFKAPEEPDSWEGTRDATAMGPMCPQYNPLTKTYTAGSEDCLTANVYSRNLTANSPVIIYISGFAYYFDGDYVDLYGPDFLVKDVVVVLFNYRKGVLGFLNLDTEAVPGNAAMKDQVALLKWVKNNIKNFGGNPNSVTLAGICSGSASIGHHMMSTMSTDLFHGAVMISGVPSCDAIYSYKVKEKSYFLGKSLGLDTKDGNELLGFLQSIPYERLINQTSHILASEEITNQLFKKMSSFVPVVEQDFGQERFITSSEDIMTSINGELVNKVKLMIGYCDQEALIVVNEYADNLISLYDRYRELFVPNKILYQISPNEVLKIGEIIKDHYFGDKTVSVANIKEFVKCNSHSCMIYDALRFARKISQLTDTYLFKFRSISSRNLYGQEGIKYGIEGASHADPAFYMFNPKPLNIPVNVNDYALIKQFVSSITNFAIYGNPTPEADAANAWPLFTTDSLNYLEFTDTMTVKQGPNSEDAEFWDSIYEMANFSLYK